MGVPLPAVPETVGCSDADATWLMEMEGLEEMEGVGMLEVEMDCVGVSARDPEIAAVALGVRVGAALEEGEGDSEPAGEVDWLPLAVAHAEGVREAEGETVALPVAHAVAVLASRGEGVPPPALPLHSAVAEAQAWEEAEAAPVAKGDPVAVEEAESRAVALTLPVAVLDTVAVPTMEAEPPAVAVAVRAAEREGVTEAEPVAEADAAAEAVATPVPEGAPVAEGQPLTVCEGVALRVALALPLGSGDSVVDWVTVGEPLTLAEWEARAEKEGEAEAEAERVPVAERVPEGEPDTLLVELSVPEGEGKQEGLLRMEGEAAAEGESHDAVVVALWLRVTVAEAQKEALTEAEALTVVERVSVPLRDAWLAVKVTLPEPLTLAPAEVEGDTEGEREGRADGDTEPEGVGGTLAVGEALAQAVDVAHAEGEGEAEREAPPLAVPLGDPHAVAVAATLAVPVTEGDRLPVAQVEAVPRGVALPVKVREPVALGEDTADHVRHGDAVAVRHCETVVDAEPEMEGESELVPLAGPERVAPALPLGLPEELRVPVWQCEGVTEAHEVGEAAAEGVGWEAVGRGEEETLAVWQPLRVGDPVKEAVAEGRAEAVMDRVPVTVALPVFVGVEEPVPHKLTVAVTEGLALADVAPVKEALEVGEVGAEADGEAVAPPAPGEGEAVPLPSKEGVPPKGLALGQPDAEGEPEGTRDSLAKLEALAQPEEDAL